MMKTFLSICLLVLIACSVHAESVCFGTTSKGRLEGGVALPSSGDNFQSYSSLGNLLGRTYVHDKVLEVIETSYASLSKSYPSKVFMYGETGKKEGGEFSPHKTHQNGLSVDFMVPVLKDGKSVYLPTSPFNKFGYGIEFDKTSRYDDYVIDYEAMAAHLVELHKEAKAKGIEIWRVIFDPQLQPNLLKTKYGEYLRNSLQFSKKRSWVRHDEHYHVDFKVDCKNL